MSAPSAHPPNGTKKPARKSNGRPKPKAKPTWKGVGLDNLKDLAQKIKQRFKWNHTPRDFQMEAIKAQLQRRNVIVHAGTGSGKTFIAAGPHAHEETAGKVECFQTEFGLTATAVNSAHGGCTKAIMADIAAGKWQVVVISPEMLLSKRFTKHVLRNPDMRERVLSVVIDEAHVVSHWGSGFRKKYGALGILRALLPKNTPFVSLSATLPPRVHRDLLKKLQYDENNYMYLNIGNDRPNVSLVVRAIQNPINSFSDLDFVIPHESQDSQNPNDVPKTFIYADNITVGSDIMEHLYEVSPQCFRESGIIRTYSAAFSHDYRREVMRLFKEGKIQVLICTDAAGMGCNIPDIDLVVQWKLPGTLSSFVQRAGRAARGPGRTGLAVLLAEKSVYDADLTEAGDQNMKSSKKKGGVREAADYPKSRDPNYAMKHGVLRGAYGRKSDNVPGPVETPVDTYAIDEGLYSFVQTVKCRRKVLTTIYNNVEANPTAPCCDLCCPELLDHTRPAAPPSKTRRKQRGTAGAVDEKLRDEIMNWRQEIWRRDFGDSLFGPEAILSNDMINSLSSYGPITQQTELKSAMGGYWAWFDRFGNDLMNLFQGLEIAPKKPKPTKPRAGAEEKRQLEQHEEMGGKDKGKRRRVQGPAETPNPTPVTMCETPRRPISTPACTSSTYPYPYSYHLPQTPLAHNPYAALATPGASSSGTPFTPHHPQAQRQPQYPPIPYGYPYLYPFGLPSSSHQTPIRYPTPYQYPPGPPPPPPPST